MQNTMQQQVKPPDEMPSEQPSPSRQMRLSFVGVALIVVGLVAILGIVTQTAILGMLVVLMLGVFFLALGIVTGRYGALIPGGILTGLGIGLLVIQEWLSGAAGNIVGSVTMIGLALGFLVITPLCWYVAKVQMWWPLIPGAILLIIGVGVLFGGPVWGEISGPLVLVALGAFLLFWRASHPASHALRQRRERHRLFGGDE